MVAARGPAGRPPPGRLPACRDRRPAADGRPTLRAFLRGAAAGVHGAGGLRARSPRCRSPPNGKVDRRALPAPAAARAARRRGYGAAPRTRAEERAGADLGARCCGVRAGRRRTTTSSSWAATRSSSIQVVARARQAGLPAHRPRSSSSTRPSPSWPRSAGPAVRRRAAEPGAGDRATVAADARSSAGSSTRTLPRARTTSTRRCCSRSRAPLDAAAPLAAALAACCRAPRRPAPALRAARSGGWRQRHAGPAGGAVALPAVDLSARRGAGREPLEAGGRAAPGEPRPGRRARSCRAVLFDARRRRPAAAAAGRPPPGGRRRLLAHPARGPARPPTAQLRAGAPAALPPKTTSFRRWARAAGRATPRSARSARGAGRLARTPARGAVAPLPVDPARRRRTPWRRRRTSSVGARRARRPAPCSRRCRAAYRTPDQRRCCSPPWRRPSPAWTGRAAAARRPRGARPRGARSTAVDLSRTVGWFTTLYPGASWTLAGGRADPRRALCERSRSSSAPSPAAASATACCATWAATAAAALLAAACRSPRSASTTSASSTRRARRDRLVPAAGEPRAAPRQPAPARGRTCCEVNAVVAGRPAADGLDLQRRPRTAGRRSSAWPDGFLARAARR